MGRAALALLGLPFVLLSGCATCASPWDYCSPVYSGGDCNTCMVDERSGSILSGGMYGEEYPVEGEIIYEGEGPYEGPYEGTILEEGQSRPSEAESAPYMEPSPTPAEEPSTSRPSEMRPAPSQPSSPSEVPEATLPEFDPAPQEGPMPEPPAGENRPPFESSSVERGTVERASHTADAPTKAATKAKPSSAWKPSFRR